jgi:hypothetical protein
MVNLEDLLFEIFEQLRLRRVPLGMPDYLLALKAIYELVDPFDALNQPEPEKVEAIKGLCRLFWAKSYEDLQLFDETFDIEMNKQFAQLREKHVEEEEPQNIPLSGTQSPFSPSPNIPEFQTPSLKEQPQQRKQPMVVPNPHAQFTTATHAKIASYQQTVRHH